MQLRAFGAEVRVCAPEDCAERLAEVGFPLVPTSQPVRPLVQGTTPWPPADLPRLAAEGCGAGDRFAAASRRGAVGG